MHWPCVYTHTPCIFFLHSMQSFNEYSLTDVELWMKAVQIDAYYQLMLDFGVKKGADLKYIGDHELQV